MNSRHLATTRNVDRLRVEHERLVATERQLTTIRQETRQLLAGVDPADRDENWSLRAELVTVDRLLHKTRQARGFVDLALRRIEAKTRYREAARLLCTAATDHRSRWSDQADQRHARMHRPTIPLRRLAAEKNLRAAALEAGAHPVAPCCDRRPASDRIIGAPPMTPVPDLSTTG